MNKEQVKKMFKIGDIIRNVKPYFGEPAYRIVGEEMHGFTATWSGSKHGPAKSKDGCRTLLQWSDFESENNPIDGPYKKCRWWTLIYLWIVGNTVGRLMDR